MICHYGIALASLLLRQSRCQARFRYRSLCGTCAVCIDVTLEHQGTHYYCERPRVRDTLRKDAQTAPAKPELPVHTVGTIPTGTYAGFQDSARYIFSYVEVLSS